MVPSHCDIMSASGRFAAVALMWVRNRGRKSTATRLLTSPCIRCMSDTECFSCAGKQRLYAPNSVWAAPTPLK